MIVALPCKSFFFAVILLGAGFSRRMGSPKLVLPWGNTTVIGHLISTWRQLHATQITVVCSMDHQPLESELRRLQFPRENRILNPNPDRGMFSSIQCAARWTGWDPRLTHWIIALGDQPHLRRETLEALINFAMERPGQICQPSISGKPRHPVLLPKPIFDELKDPSTCTLKQFLHQFQSSRSFCERQDPGLNCDLDTPADYEHGLRHFAPATANPSRL